MAYEDIEVIGGIGHKAGGKDTLGGMLAEHGYVERRISDPIRAEALKRRRDAGLHDKYSMQELMDIGDEFRLKGGNGYPAELMLDMARAAGDKRIFVNGIRNPGEIASLRKLVGTNLLLVGVTAPFMTRFTRAAARAQPEDPLTVEKFAENDDRDRGIGQPPHGQQVDWCLALVRAADPTMVYHNDGTREDMRTWTTNVVLARLTQLRTNARGVPGDW